MAIWGSGDDDQVDIVFEHIPGSCHQACVGSCAEKLCPGRFPPHADRPGYGVSAADEGVQGAQVRPCSAATADEADRDPRIGPAGCVRPAGCIRPAGCYPVQIVRQS